MSRIPPLLTETDCAALQEARAQGRNTALLSLDLQRTTQEVAIATTAWTWDGHSYPYPQNCRSRTIYYWDGTAFAPVSRFSHSLIKLVPTPWGAPTFEIDGIKMLPTERSSPFADAQRKVDLIDAGGKCVLDTCGGLGYFAVWCLQRGAAAITSFEKNPDVLWLRSLNPWSPANAWNPADSRLRLTLGDATEAVPQLPAVSFDAVLHDPPRFSIAGELYSQAFYAQLWRVLRPRGRLFHYTGAPNKISAARDLAAEVMQRLKRIGFEASASGDGVLAIKRGGR